MGTPLAPNEPGNLCPTCWGVGKTFGSGPTPLVIEVTLTDLEEADNWDGALSGLLLTPHLLEQAPLFPCNFGILDEHFAWSWVWTPLATACQVKHIVTDTDAFRASVPDLCATGMESDIIQPVFEFAMFGSASITWSLAGL